MHEVSYETKVRLIQLLLQPARRILQAFFADRMLDRIFPIHDWYIMLLQKCESRSSKIDRYDGIVDSMSKKNIRCMRAECLRQPFVRHIKSAVCNNSCKLFSFAGCQFKRRHSSHAEPE